MGGEEVKREVKMNIDKLKHLVNDETVDSLDYNIKNNLKHNSDDVLVLIIAQWDLIYKALTEG